ncbi:MAG: hypothetical protein HKN43_01100 [Rhodothermales bacterium]|nr:hypothetical protein [Rhodothermales bacterium]
MMRQFIFGCLFLVLVLVGCETAITPIVGTTQPYTVFGYLGAERDTQ